MVGTEAEMEHEELRKGEILIKNLLVMLIVCNHRGHLLQFFEIGTGQDASDDEVPDKSQ